MSRRETIFHEMQKNEQDGIHTYNHCECGKPKRGGVSKCLACLKIELREIEGNKK